jgi:hypothetical protein
MNRQEVLYLFSNDCHSAEDGKFCSNGKALSSVGIDLQDLGKFHGASKADLERIVGVINSVHGVPEGFPKAKVEVFSEMGQAEGAYNAGEKLIKLKEDGEFPLGTLCHEFGHHISLGEHGWTRQEFAVLVKETPELNTWLNAVKKTKAYNVFLGIRSYTTNTKEQRDYASYLMDPRELFARSYSQWVASRSGDKELIAQNAEVGKKANGYYQWSDAEFKPIGAALDKHFKKLGWLR